MLQMWLEPAARRRAADEATAAVPELQHDQGRIVRGELKAQQQEQQQHVQPQQLEGYRKVPSFHVSNTTKWHCSCFQRRRCSCRCC